MRFWYVLHCEVSVSDDPVHMRRLTRALLLAYTNYKVDRDPGTISDYLVILYTIMWVFKKRFMFFVMYCIVGHRMLW